MVLVVLLIFVAAILIIVGLMCDEWDMTMMGIVIFFLGLLLFAIVGREEEPQTEVTPQPKPIPMVTITEQEYILLQSFVPDSLKQGGN
jgi:membrane-bound ClpP family serine protease